VQEQLAQALYREIPAGLGSHSAITLDDAEMTAMLLRGARWAIERGYGRAEDLERIEEQGCSPGADPEIFDAGAASAFGLKQGECVVSIHCGSRGLGHLIGTEFTLRDGDRGRRSSLGSSGPRACLCTDKIRARPALSWGNAKRHQLRAR